MLVVCSTILPCMGHAMAVNFNLKYKFNLDRSSALLLTPPPQQSEVLFTFAFSFVFMMPFSGTSRASHESTTKMPICLAR